MKSKYANLLCFFPKNNENVDLSSEEICFELKVLHSQMLIMLKNKVIFLTLIEALR